jgi:hypothetical protein
MATLLDLITGAARLIGVANPGEALDAVAAQDALQALNGLIETLNLEHLTNPTGVSRVDVTCTAGKAFHTIGPGGDFDLPRPVAIDKAYMLIGSGEYPVEVIGDDVWADIPVKGVSAIPLQLYYEPENPLGKVFLWPRPAQNYAMALWVWDSLPTYTMAQLNQQLVLPPGYARMYRYNLALELAPEYGREPSAAVVNIATESKAAVKRANQTTPLMEVDGVPLSGGHSSTNLARFLSGS